MMLFRGKPTVIPVQAMCSGDECEYYRSRFRCELNPHGAVKPGFTDCLPYYNYDPPDPDLSKCPRCGGPADNGMDRCHPPNPYNCSKCEDDGRNGREQ
jgi:hypothetical protein